MLVTNIFIYVFNLFHFVDSEDGVAKKTRRLKDKSCLTIFYMCI